MKVTILQNELSRGLSSVSRVVASRGQLPVLSHVLLDATSTGLVLSATNLELGMRVSVGGKTEEEGSLTIPAKNLAEFVNTLQSEQIQLSTDGEKMKIGNGKMGGVFTGIAASEFPVFAHIGDSERFVEIHRDLIVDIHRQIAFSAATDESRPVLTGVQIRSIDDDLVVTATDGFRMTTKRLLGAKLDLLNSVILPARAIAELAKIVQEGKKEQMKMSVVSDNNQVVFVYDKTELVSRVLEGNFPDVEKIIPPAYKTRIVFDREELIRAVRAVAIFARDSNNIVKFAVRGQEFRIYSSASASGESDAVLDVEVVGDDLDIAFNYRYVLDFLASVDQERVVFESNGSLAPGVWKLVDEQTLVHLIMPVRV